MAIEHALQILRGSRGFLALTRSLTALSILSGCGGTDPTPAKTGAIDACQLVTQAEASAIFEQPATRQPFDLGTIPHLIAECEWTWDIAPTPETAANQLIQVYVYDTTDAYAMPGDAQPYAIGDTGYLRVNPTAGIDIDWTQTGKTVDLSYSKVGASLPAPDTKVEVMKAQAKKVSERL